MGKVSDYFDETDERNICYWQVTSKANETIVVVPVFSTGKRKDMRVLNEEELTNGRWWVRENKKNEYEPYQGLA